MERKRIFELLQLPMLRTPAGGLVIFEDRRRVRHVALHGTEFQIRDVAACQARQSWVLTATELFVLTRQGNRELAFELGHMAPPLGSGAFYSALIEAAPNSIADGTSYFLLNTRKGGWPLQLREQELLALTTAPMPFLASCGWRQEESVCFGGMTSRPGGQDGTPGKPATASFWPAATSNGRVPHTLDPLTVSAGWANALSRYRLSPREINQLAPECCIAASVKQSNGLVLTGLVALPHFDDPLDELCVQPLNPEYLGYLFMSLDGRTIPSGALFRHVLGALQVDSGMIWAYVTDNRGRGGAVGSLSRIEFDSSGAHSERNVTFTPTDPEAKCTKFRILQDPRVGYIASAELSLRHPKPVAHYLQSEDGLSWTVVGREGELDELPLQ